MKSSLANVHRTSNPVVVAVIAACMLTLAASVSAATSIYEENFDSATITGWSGSGVSQSVFDSDKYLELTQGDTLTYSFSLGALSAYSYSFWYSAWADVPGSSVFTVALDGNVIPIASSNDGSVARGIFDSFNPGSLASGILNKQFLSGPSVLLNTGNHTLQFKGLTGNDLDAHLDQFQSITTAVPEPGSWAMLLAGLGAMGVVGRRRRARD